MKRLFVAAVVFSALTFGVGAPLRAQFTPETPQKGKPTPPAPIDQEPHHRLMFATSDIQVYDVVIPPQQSALMFPNAVDYLAITLSHNKLTLDSPGQSSSKLDLPAGAVRMFKGGSAFTLTNDSQTPYHALSIQFLNSAILGRGCTCNDGAAQAICQCPGSSNLPPDWSLELGHLSLRGMTLAPGATYDNDSTDSTRFLVAITPFDMLDNTVHEPRSLQVRLPAGEFHWLGPGPHEIQNLASGPMRFVCVEF